MSSLKFSIVLEDPSVELGVLAHRRGQGQAVRAVAAVASGGCTALAIKAAYPEVEVTGFDVNPAQIAHAQRKVAAIAGGELERLNVGVADAQGLSQAGLCERLFASYRALLDQFVMPAAARERYFDAALSADEREALARGWLAHPFWPTIHNLLYGSALFEQIFGAQATQHTAPGSYPSHVAQAFGRGLRSPDGFKNPFLQHIFLGRYLAKDAPAHLLARRPLAVDWRVCALEQLEALERYDVLQLSNLFDWSSWPIIEQSAALLKAKVKPGATIIIRQLNNAHDLRPFFASSFRFDEGLAQALLRQERSLLYNQLLIATRV